MTKDILDPQLMTFMYFLHTQDNPHSDPSTVEEFYTSWSERFYLFDDLGNGVNYE